MATEDFVNILFHVIEAFFFLERESEWACMSGEGAVREAERENFKQASLSAPSLRKGAESHYCYIMTWARIKSLPLNQLNHPGNPEALFYL